MAINDWWVDDPAEIYWVEITQRSDLGVNLYAPQADQAGRPYWGYELVTHVRPQDVVLHWHKSILGTPGLAGWSRATGIVEDTTIEWQARGTRGRATGNLVTRPAWQMELLDYAPFLDPATEDQVRRKERSLARVRNELEAEHGTNLYFPFAISDKRPIRTTQTYLAKMPRAVLEVLGLLDVLGEQEGGGSLAPRRGKPAGRKAGSGYIDDARVRSAIEWRAVELATLYYDRLKYEVDYVGGSKPYDLVVKRGREVRRVEVKGSSATATKVELTSGEVKNARSYAPVDILVVHDIGWERNADGSVTAFGGEPRVLADWVPTDSALEVTRYRYTLPTTGWVDGTAE